MDMAVGIIVGGAFTAIVKSMVSVILNPILGIFLGGVDFSSLSVSVGDAIFSYGSFIMAVINLILVTFVWFILVRQVNRIKQATQKPQEKTHAVDPGPSEKELLADILAVLQKK